MQAQLDTIRQEIEKWERQYYQGSSYVGSSGESREQLNNEGIIRVLAVLVGVETHANSQKSLCNVLETYRNVQYIAKTRPKYEVATN